MNLSETKIGCETIIGIVLICSVTTELNIYINEFV